MKIKKVSAVYIVVTLSLVAFFFQNCGKVAVSDLPSTAGGTGNIISSTPIDHEYQINYLPATKFICEPFGDQNTGSSSGGLKAELSYIDPQSSYSTSQRTSVLATDYFGGNSNFIKVSTPIYLSQVNVPTRNFDQGFISSDGAYLSDTNGNRLIEYFALKMKTLLKLREADAEGYYELATLSDDGTKVYLDSAPSSNGNPAVLGDLIISNDGPHSVKMGCASKLVRLTRADKKAMTMYYNQGPRTEIANVLIWRYIGPTAPATLPRSSLCGVSSQGDYWHPSNQAAGSLWQTLLNEGFNVVDVGNFELPGEQVNPCAVQKTNLVVSAEITDLNESNMSGQLRVEFSETVQVKAQLYKVVGNVRTLVQSFDYSANAASQVTIPVSGIELGTTYSLDLLLVIPGAGTRVLNEVNFSITQIP